jgi:cyanate permease
MLAIVWLLYGAFGLNMRSISPIVTPIKADLNMTYGEMGIILGSWQLIYTPVAIFAGIAMDRWGIRKTLFAGALIMALSEGLRYFATGFFSLAPMVALFGVGAPFISIGAPKTISTWFQGNDRATAVGIYTTAPWIGGLFAFGATNSLVMPLSGNSWRLVFASYAAATALFAITWGILARDTGRAERPGEGSIGSIFIKLLKVPNVRLIIAAGLLVLFVDHGFTQWLPKMLENKGISSQAAGFTASIPLIAAIPAVFLVPGFSVRFPRGRFLAVLAILMVTALIITAIGPPQLLITGLVLYGFSVPTLLPMLMLTLMNEPDVGAERMGIAGGLFFTIAELGGFIGPLTMGALVDATGSFLAGILMLAAAGIAFGSLAFFLRGHR